MGILRINELADANHGLHGRAFVTIFLSIMICNGRETPYRLRISVSFMVSCVSSHLTRSACGIGQGEVTHVLKAILNRTMRLELVDHAARPILQSVMCPEVVRRFRVGRLGTLSGHDTKRGFLSSNGMSKECLRTLTCDPPLRSG